MALLPTIKIPFLSNQTTLGTVAPSPLRTCHPEGAVATEGSPVPTRLDVGSFAHAQDDRNIFSRLFNKAVTPFASKALEISEFLHANNIGATSALVAGALTAAVPSAAGMIFLKGETGSPNVTQQISSENALETFQKHPILLKMLAPELLASLEMINPHKLATLARLLIPKINEARLTESDIVTRAALKLDDGNGGKDALEQLRRLAGTLGWELVENEANELKFRAPPERSLTTTADALRNLAGLPTGELSKIISQFIDQDKFYMAEKLLFENPRGTQRMRSFEEVLDLAYRANEAQIARLLANMKRDERNRLFFNRFANIGRDHVNLLWLGKLFYELDYKALQTDRTESNAAVAQGLLMPRPNAANQAFEDFINASDNRRAIIENIIHMLVSIEAPELWDQLIKFYSDKIGALKLAENTEHELLEIFEGKRMPRPMLERSAVPAVRETIAPGLTSSPLASAQNASITSSRGAIISGAVWQTDIMAGITNGKMVERNGRLFLIDNKGKLICLNSADGVQLWEAFNPGYYDVLDDTIVLYHADRESNHELATSNRADLLEVSTGKKIFSGSLVPPQGMSGMPAHVKGILYFSTPYGLAAVNLRNGLQKEEIELIPEKRGFSFKGRPEFISNPLAGEDGTLYLITKHGLMSFFPAEKSILWNNSYTSQSFSSFLNISNNTIYVRGKHRSYSYSGLYAFDAGSGRIYNQIRTYSDYSSAVQIYDGIMYIMQPFGNHKAWNTLKAVRPDENQLWQIDVDYSGPTGNIWADNPAFLPKFFMHHGMIAVETSVLDPRLSFLRADNGEFIGSIPMPAKLSTTPLSSGNMIYLTTDNRTLHALKVGL